MPRSDVLEALAAKSIDSTHCDASGKWFHTDEYFRARYSSKSAAREVPSNLSRVAEKLAQEALALDADSHVRLIKLLGG